MISKLDHIAVAVSDLGAAINVYSAVLGLEVERREVLEEHGVEEAMLRVGDSYIQLLGSLGPKTPVGKFLAKEGEGLHHIALQVDDIDATLAKLRKSGVPLIDQTPRTGTAERRVAFLRPKACRGVLVELIEKAGGGQADPADRADQGDQVAVDGDDHVSDQR
jgi:methylmalonyl-CoA/ethylmalonyl-CoA epimerase